MLLPEWAPQSAVLLAWPHPDTDWQPWLADVEALYAELATVLTRYTHACIVCRDPRHQRHIDQQLLGRADPARLHWAHCAYNDTWVRDTGPLAVAGNDGTRLLDFRFDGWGGKYSAADDDALCACLAAAGGFNWPMVSLDWVLEGGSIDTDGQGTLLTTRSCLLDGVRNPGWDQARLEQALRTELGAQRCLWLDHGHLAGDDTDGHIDTLARFCNPATLAYVACTDPDDEHYPALQAMAAELAALRRADGRPYHLIPLPLPTPQYSADGARLPAGYANFLITNGAVLMPSYGVAEDEHALAALRSAFPDRAVHALNCRTLIEQGGSLHCITLQLPAGALADTGFVVS